MEVSLVMLAILDATARGAGISGDHTALGIFFRLQVTDFDSFLRFFLCHFILLSRCFGLP